MTSPLMPAAFIGHGSPANALAQNRYTDAWRRFGETVPTPRAILAVSAHWYINATAVTAMPRPRTIHDFYYASPELYEIQYAAPGMPELAEMVADLAKPTWVGPDVDSWGLDHGTWSVLMHAFPDASIPVAQLSLNAFKGAEYHFALGKALAPLRNEGILIVASGNVVHNLDAIDRGRGDAGFDWAVRFGEAVRETLADDPAAIAVLDGHPDFARAVPTPDHYLPLLYLAGLADSEPVDLLIDGYAAGSLSMASYALGSAASADRDSIRQR